MISRHRYGPAIRCLSLALDFLYSKEGIYRMEDSKLIRILKLYSKRALCNLRISQTNRPIKNKDRKRFLEKVLQDCNLVLHVGIFKKELLDSETLLKDELISIETTTKEAMENLLIEPNKHAQAPRQTGGRRRNRDRYQLN